MADPVLTLSSAELVTRFGLSAGTLLNQAVGLAHQDDPAAVLAALRSHREILDDPEQLTSPALHRLVFLEGGILDRLEGLGDDGLPAKGGRTFDEVYDATVRKLDEQARPAQAAAAFLHLAGVSAGEDRELSGLALVQEASQLSPEFAAANAWVLESTYAILLEREGANHYLAGDHALGLHYYLQPLPTWLARGRTEEVETLLAKIRDAARGSDEQSRAETVAIMRAVAPDLARVMGRSTEPVVSTILAGLTTAMLGAEQVDAQLLWAIMQSAIGLRTAMLVGAPALVAESDPQSAELLRRLAQLDADSTGPLSPSATTTQTNLRRAFERRREVTLTGGMSAVPFVDLSTFQELLGPEAAALVYDELPGLVGPDGPAMWIVLRISSTDLNLAIGVVDGTGPAGVLATLAEDLDALAASGRTQLCVFGRLGDPDQSLHAVPLGAGVLADTWSVSSLPHPTLLRSDAPAAGATSMSALVLGLGFSAGDRGQVPIPAALDEARSIARLTSCDPLLDEQATEAAFRAGARQASHVHIATHGIFSAGAPSFHEVLLAPDGSDDGSLFAWEIAELDLTGVQVVTLSACQSAAMSVDAYGNADGLAVTFLRAGVRTLVGTLWEIETNCSRAFFELLYAELVSGAAIGAAFRTAQRGVRKQFPDPVDWSAFYLVGDWR